MKKGHYITATVIAAVFCAWNWRDSWGYSLFVLWVLLYVGAPLLLGACIYAAHACSRDGLASLIPLKRVSTGIALLISSWGLSFGLYQLDLARAMAFPEKALPLIRKYHEVMGKLPDEITDIPGMPTKPRLLNAQVAEGGYSFSISDSRSSFGGAWVFNQADHTWPRLVD